MPVNHAKEFLKSVHNEALFLHLFSRTLIEVRSLNFKANNLKMASTNSEFLNVSMVEPAPESPARWLVYVCVDPLRIKELTDFGALGELKI